MRPCLLLEAISTRFDSSDISFVDKYSPSKYGANQPEARSDALEDASFE